MRVGIAAYIPVIYSISSAVVEIKYHFYFLYTSISQNIEERQIKVNMYKNMVA